MVHHISWVIYIYYTRQQAVLNSNERKFNISHWSTHYHGAVSVASWCVLLFLFRISSNSATHCRTRGSVKRPVARYTQQALWLGNEHSPGLELVAVLVCTCTSHARIYAPTHSPTHTHEHMNGQTHTRMHTHTHTLKIQHTHKSVKDLRARGIVDTGTRTGSFRHNHILSLSLLHSTPSLLSTFQSSLGYIAIS